MSPTPYPFLDWYGIWPSHRKEEADGRIWCQEPPRGIKIALERAQKSAIFFRAETPWESQANLRIVTMMHEGGRYRMWYSAVKAGDISANFTCYAESDDGFNWERPELGLVEYEGSTRNNIIARGGAYHLQSIFVDPSAPPAERYKAIAPKGVYYRGGKLDPEMDSKKAKELLIALDLGDVSPEERKKQIEIRQSVAASVSPDGIHWTALEDPILDVGNTQLDTHNLCTYDPYEGKYVAYLRGHVERRRLVRRAEGTDFRRLENPHFCLMPDPQDPIDDDIYNPCYCPYPGLQRYLMFPSIYHRIASTVDVHLAVSRDSYNWHRPERKPIIDLSYDGGEYGAIYAVPNLLTPSSREWRLPFVGHQRLHDFLDRGATYPVDGDFRWASWPQNRLAGLEAAEEGSCVLVQRPCAGGELHLNFRTTKDGWVKVELVHPPSTPPKPVEPFAGFGLDQAETLSGDELARVVRWNGKSDLSSLKDMEVSVRLTLYRAKLFSLAF